MRFLTTIAISAVAGVCAAANPNLPVPDLAFNCGDAARCHPNTPTTVIAPNRGGELYDELHGAYPLSEGKTLLVGFSEPATGPANVVLARLSPDGLLDSSYGSNGIAAPFIGVETIYGVSHDPAGRIWLLYSVSNPALNFALYLIRLLPNGGIDSTFNGGVAKTLDFPAPAGRGVLSIDPMGRAQVAATYFPANQPHQIQMMRVLDSGAFDVSLNGSGRLRLTFLPNLPLDQLRPQAIVESLSFTTIIVVWRQSGGRETTYFYQLDRATNSVSEREISAIGACLMQPNGSTRFVAAHPFVGDELIAVGTAQDDLPLAPVRTLYARIPASGVNVIRCADQPPFFASPHALVRYTSGVSLVVFGGGDSGLEIRALNVNSLGQIQLPVNPIAPSLTWPRPNGASGFLTEPFTLQVGRGGLILGANVPWQSGDLDFAVARFSTDLLFSDSF
jgi:Domain of unknown function (DUF5122) beta-propeller